MCSENVDMVLHAEEEPFSVNVRVFELTLLNKQALYEEKKKTSKLLAAESTVWILGREKGQLEKSNT